MITPRLRRPRLGIFQEHEARAIQRMEAGALIATDRASREGLRAVRAQMASARLGRLGNALSAGSDLRKNGRVRQLGAGGFSASGWVAIRSRSERTLGAIEAYTEGADIRPVKGRWLWIATDQIPARAGRYRMTPQRYVQAGFDTKIGPLVQIRSVNGRPLLVVKDASVNAAGRPRSARRLRRNGQSYKGQRPKVFIVAFIGIPRTSRAARVDAAQSFETERRAMPRYLNEAIKV
jgi:hypothetical protein